MKVVIGKGICKSIEWDTLGVQLVRWFESNCQQHQLSKNIHKINSPDYFVPLYDN